MTALLLGSYFQLALADQVNQILLDLTLYNPVTQDELIAEAELMVSQEINRQLSSNPNRTEIEVMVLGHRNGDVIPILKTSVSRAQWQANPDVGTWTEHYRSYALFQRHDVESTPAVATIARGSTSVRSQRSTAQIEREYDAGNLSGLALQEYLDIID